jgi:hypothetical protein
VIVGSLDCVGMWLRRSVVGAALAGLIVGMLAPSGAVSSAPGAVSIDVGSQWVRIEANLYVDTVPEVMKTVRAAKAVGADTVLFSDTKVNLWFADSSGERWARAMTKLRDGIHAEGMALVVAGVPLGYCTPVLANNPRLVTGAPLRRIPLKVRGRRLVPISTAALRNGSFERVRSGVPRGWESFDTPRATIKMVTSRRHRGANSVLFSNAKVADQQMARLFTTVKVRPFQQYSLRFWVRARQLRADFLGPYVVDAKTRRSLTAQHYSVAGPENTRRYLPSPRNWTSRWVEQRIAFNSLTARRVRLALGVWGWERGKLWLDDVRIQADPLLNVVRRPTLPLSLRTAENDKRVPIKANVGPIKDRGLGRTAYPGYYDTYHRSPRVKLRSGTRLKPGQRLTLDGYHAQVTTAGQVGCSWHDPAALALMNRIYAKAAQRDFADAYMIDLDEVRTGGWEPADRAYGNSSKAFAAHVQKVTGSVSRTVGGPVYVWGDMLDPTQNAVAEYYHVRGSLTNSWVGVDPDDVVVVNWKDLDDAERVGKRSFAHFDDLGFQQVVAGFYDQDVASNHAAWQRAIDSRTDRLVATMYTTWREDYSQLPAFAGKWWR